MLSLFDTADAIIVVCSILTALSETVSGPTEVNRTCRLVPIIKDGFAPAPLTVFFCLLFIKAIIIYRSLTTVHQSKCMSAGVWWRSMMENVDKECGNGECGQH